MHIYIYITTMFTFWWLPCSPSYPFPPPSWPPGTVPGVPTAARPRPPCRCAARLRRPQRCRATGDATDLLMFRWKIIWNLVGGWGNIYMCDRNVLPALKSPIVCTYTCIHCFWQNISWSEVICLKAYVKSLCWICTSSTHGLFSVAMIDYQRIIIT